jgi:diadenosine tetraphosphatase ApaH/serine/threonine PP2A family protein phosphatase
MCDLLWSDPEGMTNGAQAMFPSFLRDPRRPTSPHSTPDVEDWQISPRGAGYLFGASAAKEVCSWGCRNICLADFFPHAFLLTQFCYSPL